MTAQTYEFESPGTFLRDFGVEASVVVALPGWTFDGARPTFDANATFDSYGGIETFSASVILSEPGEDIEGGRIASNQYEIEYETAELPLAFNVTVTIDSIPFTVIQTYQVDDGVFSRARLEGAPITPSYAFEAAAPESYLADFGKSATSGSSSALAILSEPGHDILGGEIESNQYEIEYLTSQFSLGFGTNITVNGIAFTVIQAYLVDDGKFSRALLEI